MRPVSGYTSTQGCSETLHPTPGSLPTCDVDDHASGSLPTYNVGDPTPVSLTSSQTWTSRLDVHKRGVKGPGSSWVPSRNVDDPYPVHVKITNDKCASTNKDL